jgi:hypothetical protein
MGSSKKKTTQTYKPPAWVEAASRQAIGLGQRIGSQRFEPYTGERVAGLSDNEQRGIALAGSSAGSWRPYIDSATSALQRFAQPFTSANISSYMNPYIKGALDPAAREIRDQGALRLNELQATQALRSLWQGLLSGIRGGRGQMGTGSTGGAP